MRALSSPIEPEADPAPGRLYGPSPPDLHILGIALGRYLFAGTFWGFMGLIGSPVTESYPLHFS